MEPGGFEPVLGCGHCWSFLTNTTKAGGVRQGILGIGGQCSQVISTLFRHAEWGEPASLGASRPASLRGLGHSPASRTPSAPQAVAIDCSIVTPGWGGPGCILVCEIVADATWTKAKFILAGTSLPLKGDVNDALPDLPVRLCLRQSMGGLEIYWPHQGCRTFLRWLNRIE